ncbi:hypothetical protein [Pedobacter sp. NJ-S-72]
MVPVSDIEVGDFLVNLGSVIETERLDTHYNIIIARLNEKQVLKFERDTILITT